MDDLTGTWPLARLAVRRSRVMLGVWIVAFGVLAATSAAATVGLYPDVGSRVEAADAINRTTSLVALYGRVYDPMSLGAVSMIKLGGFGALFVAMLSVVLVVRHTRAEEEAGRSELVGATAVGRLAPIAAALVVVVVADLVLAFVTALGLIAAGLPIEGSFGFGLAWAGVGVAFGAIAALIAQLTTSSRAATSMSAVVLAVVYLLRAVGDAADENGARWLSWLSPIGWGQQFRPFAGDRWWVLLVTVAFSIVVGGAAFAVARRRDLGTGVLEIRSGPANAAPGLRSPLSLAWRLQRVSFLGWAVMFLCFGALLGSLVTNLGDFFTSAAARDVFTLLGGEKGIEEQFLAVELAFAGIIASAYGIETIMHLHTEETDRRAEPVLATSVGPVRWSAGHLVVAFGGTAVMIALFGAGAGLTYGIQAGDPGRALDVFAASLLHIPAAWVLIALTVLAFGVAPRLVAVGWGALALFVFLGEIGPLLKLNHWIMDLSPFVHVPKLPGGSFSATPIVLLVLISVAMVVGGLVGLRRRDIL
jgi:ABC-2 type transport system permease protein